MAKIEKSSLKSVQNRKRVDFHRRVRAILSYENRPVNNGAETNSKQNSRDNSNQEQKEDVVLSLSERLRRWALKYNISKRAVSDLLKILISLGMTWLPKDSRTLLSTPRDIGMTNLTNGKMWYDVIFDYSFQINGFAIKNCANLESIKNIFAVFNASFINTTSLSQ